MSKMCSNLDKILFVICERNSKAITLVIDLQELWHQFYFRPAAKIDVRSYIQFSWNQKYDLQKSFSMKRCKKIHWSTYVKWVDVFSSELLVSKIHLYIRSFRNKDISLMWEKVIFISKKKYIYVLDGLLYNGDASNMYAANLAGEKNNFRIFHGNYEKAINKAMERFFSIIPTFQRKILKIWCKISQEPKLLLSVCQK